MRVEVAVWVIVEVEAATGVRVAVKVGEEVGVGVVCATLAALNENEERIRIAKAINLPADLMYISNVSLFKMN